MARKINGSVESVKPTGAPRQLADDGDFVMVRMSVVDAVGFDAAVLFGWLRFRCDLHADGYEATYETLSAETRLSARRLKQAVKRLRDIGWIRSDRASAWNPTQVWSVRWERPAREVQNGPHERNDSDLTSFKKPKKAAAAAGTSTNVPELADWSDEEKKGLWSFLRAEGAKKPGAFFASLPTDERLDRIAAYRESLKPPVSDSDFYAPRTQFCYRADCNGGRIGNDGRCESCGMERLSPPATTEETA